jgi:hypothetical protein
MSSNRERAPCRAMLFDLSELRTLYETAELRQLIGRALAQFDDLQGAFDAHLAAGANVDAAHTLHQLTGTASFFCGNEDALTALHCARSALNSSDAELLRAAMPRARRVLTALAQALVAELAALE